MREIYTPLRPAFPMGQPHATPGARDAYRRCGVNLSTLLARHGACDWSQMSEDDQAANRAALSDGSRIFSAYDTAAGRLWVITEADRSSTTILLPSEY